MKLPWKVKQKTTTSAELKLEEIKEILFPKYKLDEITEANGNITKFNIDYSADTNLDAVLIDLQDNHNDSVTHKTINGVIKRLYKVRHILEAYHELNPEAEYIIVDDVPDKFNIADIE